MGCTISVPRDVDESRSASKSRRLPRRWLKSHKCQTCHSAVSCKSITVTNSSNYTVSSTTANISSETEPLTGSPQTQSPPPSPLKTAVSRSPEPPAKEQPSLPPMRELQLQRERERATAALTGGATAAASTSATSAPPPLYVSAPAPEEPVDPTHMTFSPVPDADSDEEYPTSSVRDRAALFDQIDARSHGNSWITKQKPKPKPKPQPEAEPGSRVGSALLARIQCFETNPNTQEVLTPDTKLFTFRPEEV